MKRLSMRDNWLDNIPHKDFFWHEIYDLDRKIGKPEIDIAMDIEERLMKLIACATTAKDQSNEDIAKYEDAVLWLQERLT